MREENEGLTDHAAERRASRSERARLRAEKAARRAEFRAYMAARRAAQKRWELSCPALAGRPGMNALNAARKTAKDQAVIALGRYVWKWRKLPKCGEAEAWERAFTAVFGEATPFSAPTMRDYERRASAYADAFFIPQKETTPNTRQVFGRKGNKDTKRSVARAHPHRLENPARFFVSTFEFRTPASPLCGDAAGSARVQSVTEPPPDGDIPRRSLSSVPPAIRNLARAVLPRLRRLHNFGGVKWNTGAAFSWLCRCLAAGKDDADLVSAYESGLRRWESDAQDFLEAKREALTFGERDWLAPSGLIAALYRSAAALPTLSAEEIRAVSAARKLCRAAYRDTESGRVAEALREEARDRRRAAAKAVRAKLRAANAAPAPSAGFVALPPEWEAFAGKIGV